MKNNFIPYRYCFKFSNFIFMIDATVFRRVLLMVRELHLMGYELLRISPGMSPSGLHWRCTISSADRFQKFNGAMIESHDDEPANYTSANEDEYFHWDDVKVHVPGNLPPLDCF